MSLFDGIPREALWDWAGLVCILAIWVGVAYKLVSIAERAWRNRQDKEDEEGKDDY